MTKQKLPLYEDIDKLQARVKELEGYEKAWKYLENVRKSGELTEVMDNIKNMFVGGK